jgi:hypothetical protein
VRALVAALALLAAVTTGALLTTDSPTAKKQARATPSERPDGVRRCRNRIEGGGPIQIDAKKRDVRIGRVVFFGLRRAATDRLESYRGRDYLIKSAIAVRAGKPVFLRIPPEARDHITLDYATKRNGAFFDVRRVADGQFVVRVNPCPPATRQFTNGRPIGRWTAFSGGFVFNARGCYPIEASRPGGGYARRLVGFGKRCGGG